MKNTKKAFMALMGILLLLTLVPLSGYPAVPQKITYQGYLTDPGGDPVPDGDYLLSFALYDVPTGGDPLWGEAQTITVTNGIYNVILGQPGNELNPSDFEGNLYLGVTVGGDSEMTPRQPITAVGYALRAGVADSVKEGAVTELMLQDSAVTTAKLKDNAITESKIENGTVTTIKLQDGATLAEIKDNDGAGSGLDADLFDGYDSSAFMPAGTDHWVDEAGDIMTGKLEISVSSGDGLYSTTTSTVNTRAIFGWASATTGYTYGVWGESNSTSGRGVYGFTGATSGETYGVYGQSESTDGSGVYGTAPYYGVEGYVSATHGSTYGVYGRSTSNYGRGVYGTAPFCGVEGYVSATTGSTYGVYGHNDSTSGFGVIGWATATTGSGIGVYGQSNSTSGYDFYAGGPGTNYGPFTGAHEVKLSTNFPGEVTPGLIVAAMGEAQRRENSDGSINLSSTLPTVKLAERANDKAVFGVLVAEVSLPEDHWYEGKEGERFATVNALGEGRVWVTDSNGSLEAGDYITTSSIPGYGQRQDDDLIHSYTLGKAIETINWDTVTQTLEFNGRIYKVYLIAVVYTSG